MATDHAATARPLWQQHLLQAARPATRQATHQPSGPNGASHRSRFAAWSCFANEEATVCPVSLGDTDRTDLACQGIEPFKLVLQQRPRLVAAHEHLEHHTAIPLEKLHEPP